jgi:hypothetical protein
LRPQALTLTLSARGEGDCAAARGSGGRVRGRLRREAVRRRRSGDDLAPHVATSRAIYSRSRARCRRGAGRAHMMLPAPSSPTSLRPTGSVWYVAKHWRRQYSLGGMVSERSLNWSSHSPSMPEDVRDPADTGLAQHHPYARVVLQHAAVDHRHQDLGHVDLEAGCASRRPCARALLSSVTLRRAVRSEPMKTSLWRWSGSRADGVEAQRQAARVITSRQGFSTDPTAA